MSIERPHEALGQQTPAEWYESSARPYPDRVPEVEYPGHHEVRRVGRRGQIKWQRREVFVSKVLTKERVGLEEIEDGVWQLCFGPVVLGRYDEREKRLP